MPDRVLIYDGDCAYCRGFAKLLRTLDKERQFIALKYDHEDAKALLTSQFGDLYGFSMYLFETAEVSWGKEAARRMVRTLKLPQWLGNFAFKSYPYLVNLVSKLTRREQKVCGPECFARNSKEAQQLWTETKSESKEILDELSNNRNRHEKTAKSSS